MSPELNERLAQLLGGRKTAALGTLHAGAPYVSMAPYALIEKGFLIHVSRLAAHTKDMLADPRVSLLIAEAEGETSPLALARASIEGKAVRVLADAPQQPMYKATYLARFPDAKELFGFADFSLFLIRPETARFVAGFGQAHSLTGESLLKLLPGAATASR